MKWFKRLFKKKRVMLTSYHTGTNGMKKHDEFIKWINANDVEIINSYITYHKDYKDNHLPEYINYVVKYTL
jgi:hypothetical protein